MASQTAEDVVGPAGFVLGFLGPLGVRSRLAGVVVPPARRAGPAEDDS